MTKPGSDHDRAKQIIATTLTNHAHGRTNAISSQALADQTPVSASTVRDLIPIIRREYRLPIGSANGYFLIQCREEYVRQIERQLAQAETSRETARDISAAYNSGLSGSL